MEASISLLVTAHVGPAAAAQTPVSLAALCEQQADRQPQHPEPSRLPRKGQRVRHEPKAAPQEAGHRLNTASAGTVSETDLPVASSLRSADAAGCSRAVPWLDKAQQSNPREPLHWTVRREADAAWQRGLEPAAGSVAVLLNAAAAPQLHAGCGFLSSDSHDAALPTPPPFADRAVHRAPHQPSSAAGGAPSAEYLPPPPLLRRMPAHVGDQHQQQHRRAASPCIVSEATWCPSQQPRKQQKAQPLRQVHLSNLPSRQTETGGVGSGRYCQHCYSHDHVREACLYSDSNAKKRRKKARLAKKASQAAMKAAHSAGAADSGPPAQPQPAPAPKRKRKGGEHHDVMPCCHAVTMTS